METTTHDTAKFIEMAESLPIEMRLEIIDRLLESVHPKQSEIDELWLKEAEQRSEEIRSGTAKTVKGEVFIENARKKLGL